MKKDLRIKKIELFKVPPRWLFLKMTTECGLVGWGEPVVEGKADSVAAAVRELGAQLIGHDASNIEDAFQLMYRCGFYRGGPVLTSAISGIEQAMWDIKGKYLGVPVYDLLGGKVRDKIQVYRWIGGDHPRDVVNEAAKAIEQGYKAIKMNGTDELKWVDSHDKLDACVERVAALRENYPDLGIAVDFHGRVHKTMAKVLMHKLEPYKKVRRLELYIELKKGILPSDLIQNLRDMNISVERIHFEQGNTVNENAQAVVLSLGSLKKQDRSALVQKIRELNEILYLEVF